LPGDLRGKEPRGLRKGRQKGRGVNTDAIRKEGGSRGKVVISRGGGALKGEAKKWCPVKNEREKKLEGQTGIQEKKKPTPVKKGHLASFHPTNTQTSKKQKAE